MRHMWITMSVETQGQCGINANCGMADEIPVSVEAV
jgi:hypothetical protein